MESAVEIIFSLDTSSKAEKIMLATLVPWSGIFGSKLVIIVSTWVFQKNTWYTCSIFQNMFSPSLRDFLNLVHLTSGQSSLRAIAQKLFETLFDFLLSVFCVRPRKFKVNLIFDNFLCLWIFKLQDSSPQKDDIFVCQGGTGGLFFNPDVNKNGSVKVNILAVNSFLDKGLGLWTSWTW